MPKVPGPVPVMIPPLAIPAPVTTLASLSGKVNIRGLVGPVTENTPSPTSLQGCPGLGVLALTIFITEKETPRSKTAVRNILNLEVNFFISV